MEPSEKSPTAALADSKDKIENAPKNIQLEGKALEKENKDAEKVKSTALFNRLKTDGYLIEENHHAVKVMQLVDNAVLALHSSGFDPLSDEACLDNAAIVKCFNQSKWTQLLDSTQITKLTELAQYSIDKGKRQCLTAYDFVLMIVWLGDTCLSQDEAIPAKLAIDFIHYCIKSNEQMRQRFCGFVSQKQLKAHVAKISPAISIVIFHFSYNFFPYDHESGAQSFRNLVLSNTEDTQYPHRLLFSFNPTTSRVVEASDKAREYYLKKSTNVSQSFKENKSSADQKSLTVPDSLTQASDLKLKTATIASNAPQLILQVKALYENLCNLLKDADKESSKLPDYKLEETALNILKKMTLLAEQEKESNKVSIEIETLLNQIINKQKNPEYALITQAIRLKPDPHRLITRLLELKANPNKNPSQGEKKFMPPIHYGIEYENILSVKALIEHKADVNELGGVSNHPPLALALSCAFIHRSSVGDLSLMSVNINAIKEEVLNKAKKTKTPILIKNKNKFYIYGDKNGDGTWIFTEITGDLDELQQLPFHKDFIRRSDPEFTLSLINTLKQGNPQSSYAYDIVKMLIAARADVNYQPSNRDPEKDSDLQVPLLVALNDVRTTLPMACLLEAQCDPNIRIKNTKNGTEYLLTIAFRKFNFIAASYLLENKADANLPFEEVLNIQNERAVDVLLRAGADSNRFPGTRPSLLLYQLKKGMLPADVNAALHAIIDFPESRMLPRCLRKLFSLVSIDVGKFYKQYRYNPVDYLLEKLLFDPLNEYEIYESIRILANQGFPATSFCFSDLYKQTVSFVHRYVLNPGNYYDLYNYVKKNHLVSLPIVYVINPHPEGDGFDIFRGTAEEIALYLRDIAIRKTLLDNAKDFEHIRILLDTTYQEQWTSMMKQRIGGPSSVNGLDEFETESEADEAFEEIDAVLFLILPASVIDIIMAYNMHVTLLVVKKKMAAIDPIFNLGCKYLYDERDLLFACEEFEKAVINKHVAEKYLHATFSKMTRLAEQGDLTQLENLSSWYLNHNNFQKAFEYCKRVTEFSFSNDEEAEKVYEAKYNLASMYFYGEGVTKDELKAAQILTEVIDWGKNQERIDQSLNLISRIKIFDLNKDLYDPDDENVMEVQPFVTPFNLFSHAGMQITQNKKSESDPYLREHKIVGGHL